MLDRVSGSNLDLSGEFQVKERDRVPRVNEVRAEYHADFQREFHQGFSKENAGKVIDRMNDYLKASNSHLKFEFHEKLKEYYVTLVDGTTNEIVREIPPKKLLDMYAAMNERLGVLFDRKA